MKLDFKQLYQTILLFFYYRKRDGTLQTLLPAHCWVGNLLGKVDSIITALDHEIGV